MITLLQQRGIGTLGAAVAASRATLSRPAGPVALQLLTGSDILCAFGNGCASNGVIFTSVTIVTRLSPMPAGDDAPEEP